MVGGATCEKEVCLGAPPSSTLQKWNVGGAFPLLDAKMEYGWGAHLHPLLLKRNVVGEPPAKKEYGWEAHPLPPAKKECGEEVIPPPPAKGNG